MMGLEQHLIELFNDFEDSLKKGLFTGCLAKVVSFNREKMRADVQPLVEVEEKGKIHRMSVITDLPVGYLRAGKFYIRPDYEKGDLVFCSFSAIATENGLNDSYDSIEGELFPRESGFVVCGVAGDKFAPPTYFSKHGLLLGHESGGVTIQLTEDTVKIDGKLEIDDPTAEKAVLGESLKMALETFCTSIAAAAPGNPAQNAAAIGVIQSAAATLKTSLMNILGSKVKVK